MPRRFLDGKLIARFSVDQGGRLGPSRRICRITTLCDAKVLLAASQQGAFRSSSELYTSTKQSGISCDGLARSALLARHSSGRGFESRRNIWPSSVRLWLQTWLKSKQSLTRKAVRMLLRHKDRDSLRAGLALDEPEKYSQRERLSRPGCAGLRRAFLHRE